MSLPRRALTGVIATVVLAAGPLAGATPASAAPGSGVCPHAESTRLFTANDGEYKLWVWQTENALGWDETHLCFSYNVFVAGDLVVRHPVQGSVMPVLQPDLDDETCPVSLNIQDPVPLVIRTGNWLSNPGYVCFGIGDQAVRLRFGPPRVTLTPAVVLYLDRFTSVGEAFCALPAHQYCFGDHIRVPIL